MTPEGVPLIAETESPKTVSHVPPTPFGCPVFWGAPIYLRDMGTHVCRRDDGHDGRHTCTCGSWIGSDD